MRASRGCIGVAVVVSKRADRALRSGRGKERRIVSQVC
jgi:hypothetical protein